MPAEGLQALLMVALYGFLGTLLVFLWKDERRAALGAPAPPPAHLRTLADEDATAFPLVSSTLLGRSADNAICLDDPLVSAHHARISFAGGQWLVEDMGSRNGTLVNELRVESPIALAPGDVLKLGGFALRFESGEAPATAFTEPAPDGVAPGGGNG
jgi:pSer/pThr/pTyr-binding forkhead associated (FHA) protein